MKAEKLKQIEDLYHEALALPLDARPGFLESACNTDTALRSEVESLLSFEDTSDNFLDDSPGSLIAEMFDEREKQHLIGTTIDHYKILSAIGEGGMGTVYLAQDTKLLRQVALKIFPAKDIDDENRLKRFIYEARAASALNHPHIMTIYEIGKDLDLHYIAMEYVEGITLHELIHHHESDLHSTLKYLIQAAEGLHKAHEAGIVHRDLKPENIMISSDGYAKILDFGLAKLIEEKSDLHKAREHLSMQGVIMGTLGYMSPEQAQSKADIDQRSDIFSFGCILYEAVSRRKPFAGESPFDTLNKIVNLEPEPLFASSEVKQIVDRCLRKSPDDRFQTIKEVLDLLKKIDPQLVNARPAKMSQKPAAISRSMSEERRQTTTLYADLAAFSQMLEDLDLEEAGELMNGLFDIIEQTVDEANGKIEKRLNDVFIAVWGANAANEDDPENAIHAALALQTAAANFAADLRAKGKISSPEDALLLKIGISTGTVVLGRSTDTGEFLTSGTAVNVAKRLHLHSMPGEILISHETYRHVRGVFDATEFTSPNLNERSKVYLISGSRPRAFRFSNRGVEGIETRIVGRSGELEKIFDALQTVFEDNELQAISIVADAGIGKSRLLFEFRDRLNLTDQMMRLFIAVGGETKYRSPYSLIRELFAVRFEIQDDDAPQSARDKFVNGFLTLCDPPDEMAEDTEMRSHFIGHLLGFDFSASPHLAGVLRDLQQIYARALSYMAEFFTVISREMPVLLIFDDLHWADGESLDLIDHVIRNCASAKLLVLEFARPGLYERRPNWGEGRKNSIRLDLSPLSKRESRQLADDILQKIPDENAQKRLREIVVSNADGNPFYLEELVKMLIDRGAITTTGEHWTVNEALLETTDVPTTLTGVLQARLDRLNDKEKIVLQRASVIGREFWDKALTYIAPDDELERALTSLRRKELLFRNQTSAFSDTSQYLFKHAILHNVTYNTVLLADRREWHKKTAEWLVAESGERAFEYSATIAGHFENAKDIARSAEWFGNAGELSLNTNASRSAVGYLEKAISFAKQDGVAISTEQLMKWHFGLGRSLYIQAENTKAIEAMTEMSRLAETSGDKLKLSDALAHLSIYKFEKGEVRESLEIVDKAISYAREAGDSDGAKIKLIYAQFRRSRVLVDFGKTDEAIKTIEDALPIAEALGDKALFEHALLYHAMSIAKYMISDLEGAVFYTKKELAIMRQLKNFRTIANALCSLGEFERAKGNYRRSLEYQDEALAIANEYDLKSATVIFTVNRCGALVGLGEFEKAEKQLTPLILKMCSTGHFILAEALCISAQAKCGTGKIEEAEHDARRSLEISVAAGSPQAIVQAWRVLAKIAAAARGTMNIDGKDLTADDCFDNAFNILISGDLKLDKAQTLRERAIFELTRNNTQKAKDLDAQATEIFTQLKITPEPVAF